MILNMPSNRQIPLQNAGSAISFPYSVVVGNHCPQKNEHIQGWKD